MSYEKSEKYNPGEIEPKWQAKWEEEKIYQPDLDNANSSKKFYHLNMFPYPSAEGLHVGNMYAFTGGDIYGRFRRMLGSTVFQPMGLDGFGIHSENYALKIGSHPMEQADISEKNFYRQLRTIGNGYDWTRTIETWKPDYYKWTQWVFTELFKAGLAYRAASDVNWCPSCKTVLADEQVIDGLCERCSSQVEKKQMEQWFFRITNYSERLLTDLEKIDWTEKVKLAQKNWIGRSVGAEIEFRITNHESRIKVFTTRPDTLHGATFMVISPEHPLVAQLLAKGGNSHEQSEVRAYVEQAAKKSDKDRRDEAREKTGVFSGIFAINPVNNRQIPIWIADYVLAGYGTGAIMAVPAHDLRDFEFAKKYDLPIQHVIMPSRVDLVNPPQEGKKNTKRRVVLVVVKNPKDQTYLTLKWKDQPWQTFITGGLEEGEDPVEAAKREVIEETGYSELNFIRELGGPTEAFFYAAHKGVNRQTTGHLLYFELESEKKSQIADEESERYDVEWMTEKEIHTAKLRHSELDLIWERLKTGNDAYTGPGVLINSGAWDGWKTPEAKQQATAWLTEKAFGQKQEQYHLRDWLISRQRYWGAPVPMIYCQSCAEKGDSWFTWDQGGRKQEMGISNSSEVAGWYPEDNLPVILPKIADYRPLGTGKAPLANHPEFYVTACPGCGGSARRETDVADTFLDSGWYFLRYPATDLKNIPFPMGQEMSQEFISDEEKEKIGNWKLEIENSVRRTAWLPVDQYIGGAEHSVLHLLYSRFITKVFFDLGMLSHDEPFPQFFAHGLIIKDGAKMSKSKGNVVVPDDYIKKYGADTLRTYLMFLGPFSEGGDFQDAGIAGINKFLKRVWTLFTTREITGTLDDRSAKAAMHKAIRGVTTDISTFRYNTAIAKIMTWYNTLSDRQSLTEEEITVFLKLLAPFAPHMTEELYQRIMNHEARSRGFESIHTSTWPEFDESLLVEDTVTIAVQVNGKLRDTVRVETAISTQQSEIEKLAKESEKVKKFIDGREIKKSIYVPGKILNLVI